jgi:sulfotransferase family protein
VIKVVGAGLGRTGTLSLQSALQQLLGAPCYHMLEVVAHPDHVPIWHAAIRGDALPDWDELLRGYSATVDWPACTFWRELADAYPDAPVLLSTRPADDWWKSANATIFEGTRGDPPDDPIFGPQGRMIRDMFALTFTPDWSEEGPAKAAYDAHNAEVRATIPKDRLTEWHPGDGWGPLCDMLDVAVPDEPFPHVNTTEEFRAMTGLDTKQ